MIKHWSSRQERRILIHNHPQAIHKKTKGEVNETSKSPLSLHLSFSLSCWYFEQKRNQRTAPTTHISAQTARQEHCNVKVAKSLHDFILVTFSHHHYYWGPMHWIALLWTPSFFFLLLAGLCGRGVGRQKQKNLATQSLLVCPSSGCDRFSSTILFIPWRQATSVLRHPMVPVPKYPTRPADLVPTHVGLHFPYDAQRVCGQEREKATTRAKIQSTSQDFIRATQQRPKQPY
jgi:hypothetical protein